jgi:hypothetical protein
MKNTGENSKSIWKKSWKGPRGLLLWFVLLTVAAFIVVFCFGMGSAITSPMPKLVAFALICAVSIAVVGILMVTFIRWLCCWRNLRRFLLGLVCLAVLVALFYAEEDWRGWHAWQKFKHEWETKGERFDFASFIPPPVPDDQNFAMTPIVAGTWEAQLDKDGHRVVPDNTNVINRLEMSIYGDNSLVDWPTNGSGYWLKETKTDLKVWQLYYRALATKTNEFPTAPQPQLPATDVLLALSKYDSAIEELRQASQMPYARFPLNYDAEQPFDTLFPHLAVLKRCSQVLQLRAIAELENDQSEKSLADVKLLLRLAGSIRSEPFLISHLVRLAMIEIALQPIWEGLTEHKWSEAQLAELEGELEKQDFLADFQFSMRGERACGIGAVDYMRRHRNYREFVNLFFVWGNDENSTFWDNSIDWKDRAKAAGFYLMPSGWFYQNDLAIAQIYQHWSLPMVDIQQQLVSPEIARQAGESLASWKPTPWNVLAKMMLPTLNVGAARFSREQISVDLTRTACALERYRLAHDEYPESLDALAPQFIAKLPHDIINGQPLHYRRTSDGQFVLYSVGWNEKDDGGVIGLREGGSVDITKGDWVWRYPSK